MIDIVNSEDSLNNEDDEMNEGKNRINRSDPEKFKYILLRGFNKFG